MKREILRTHTLGDPALAGLSVSQIIKYGSSRDAEDLPPDAARDAMVFHFRRLSRAQLFDFVETASSDKRKFERAFMAGLIRITGGDLPEGGWEPEGVGTKTHVAMTADELEALLEYGIAIALTVDVGQVVYVRSLLAPKAVPAFPQLPSSLLAWDALERPSAEPTHEEPGPSSEEPSKE